MDRLTVLDLYHMLAVITRSLGQQRAILRMFEIIRVKGDQNLNYEGNNGNMMGGEGVQWLQNEALELAPLITSSLTFLRSKEAPRGGMNGSLKGDVKRRK